MSEYQATAESVSDSNVTEGSVNTCKKGFAPGMSWLMLFVLWGLFAVNASTRELINKVMPAVVEAFNISATTSGLIGTLGVVGTGLMSFPLARFSDNRGQAHHRKRTLIPVAIIYALLTMLVGSPAICSGIVMLGGLQFVKFLFAGGGENIEVSATAEWWPVERRGFVLGAHHTGYPWGTTLTGLLIAAILAASGNNWRLCFVIVPLLGIPFWIFYWILSNKSNFEKNNAKMKELGLTPSVEVDVAEAAQEARKNQAVSAEMEKHIEKTPMRKLFKNPNVLGCFICYIGVIAAFFGLSYWITPFLAFVGKYDFSQAAAYSVIFSITGGLGQIVWGYISDKIGCKRTLLICTGWLIICYMFLPNISRGLGWLISIQLILGFCTYAVFPVLMSFASSSVKKTEMATAIAIGNTSTIFGGLMPFALGVIISTFGGWETATGYYYGLYLMIALLCVSFLTILLITHDAVGPFRGKDWALTSYKSCGIED